jgi:hypothetical protein
MKYGNVLNPLPGRFAEESAALKDLYNKGEIDRSVFFEKKRKLDYEAGMWIAQSNSKIPGQKELKKMFRKTLSQWRNQHLEQETLKIGQQLAEDMDQVSGKSISDSESEPA